MTPSLWFYREPEAICLFGQHARINLEAAFLPIVRNPSSVDDGDHFLQADLSLTSQ
jgi:hypothetical protein